MNPALNALYALQKVDSELAAIHKAYQAMDPGRAEKAAAESARAIYERMERAHHDTATDIRDSELELKTLEAKRAEFETKLYSGKVTATKELQSIQAEIDALGRQRARLDERILTLMEQLEQRRSEEADAKAALDAAETAYAARNAKFKAAERVLAIKARALTADRNEKAKPIAPALLKRYDIMRASKQGVAIARLEGGGCSACHTNLPSFLMRTVEDTDRIETCENCGRLLCVGD